MSLCDWSSDVSSSDLIITTLYTLFSPVSTIITTLYTLFSPVSIIPPTLHIHLHLHVAITRQKNGQKAGNPT
jgi:hypothetical protein